MSRIPSPLPVIVAAAGQSRRYGRPKLLELMSGCNEKSLIGHVVTSLATGGAGTILVVMGPADQPPYDLINKELIASGGIPLHVSPAPLEMRDSIQAGIGRLEKLLSETQTVEPSHFLFMPADLPGISPAYVAKLIKTCTEHEASLIRGLTPQGRGVHPVAVAWRDRHKIREIPPDQGLNQLWNMPELVRHEWAWHEEKTRFDLDNPQDWDKFRQDS